MRPLLGSLRNKVALLFAAVVALAMAAIYFLAVPQLQTNLTQQRTDDLLRAARGSVRPLDRITNGDIPAPQVDRTIRSLADNAGARVTLLAIQRSDSGAVSFFPLTDSREQLVYPRNDELARKATTSGRVQTESTRFGREDLAQVAQPIRTGDEVVRVALYSASLEDTVQTVGFIRNRILVATAVALLLALAGGTLVAQSVARRVRRVERRAGELAAGRFSEPLPVDSEDELGQLTRAFNEMAQQLSQVDVARKEFVATASHELRTPIFSLSGFVELLLDEELDEATRREFLETMSEQVERLQKLAVDLLDLSRLDAGSVELAPEEIDLAELARSVVSEFRPAVSRHGTELSLDLPEAGVDARADREKVAQIMRILLDNALRHTPEGTPVTVSADRDNGAAEFTVADSGPGMSQGADGHVFERFWTGDATTGAGLGLAIAKELAEHMNGDISVSARPGRTAFTLELPREER
ncbi:MAG: HAMP domain-containing histidine kinase [Thermoleophilaceae bacterium]|nr:HAMP domain-containing histidine kinase [Thermoleophilaceae bacterium]